MTLKPKISNIDPAEAQRIEQLQSELKSVTSDYRYQLAQAAVDAAGIIDPTPVSDVIGAGMSIAGGDYIGAGLSLISAFPYVGDALGKSAKAARAARRITAAQRKIKKITEALVAAEKRADNKLLKQAAKSRAAQKAATAKKAAQKKVKQNCPDETFSGKLRGEKIELKNVKTKQIKYTKRSKAELDKLRKSFSSTERAKFLKGLASDPKKVKRLKESGLSDTQIKQISNGKVPDGYQIHHKLPIDDGGTNLPENLILIKNEPYHKVITNFQNENLRGMKPGDSKILEFPIPDGFVYP